MDFINKYFNMKYGAIVLFLVILVSLFVTKKKQGVDVFCRAYYSQHEESGHYSMNSSFIFSFKKNGTARISIDGVVNFYDKTYFLSRNIDINYKYVEKNIYQLSNSVVVKSGRDNIPNEIFDKNLFSFSESADKFFTVNKIDNIWLIGSLYSPGFICRATN